MSQEKRKWDQFTDPWEAEAMELASLSKPKISTTERYASIMKQQNDELLRSYASAQEQLSFFQAQLDEVNQGIQAEQQKQTKCEQMVHLINQIQQHQNDQHTMNMYQNVHAMDRICNHEEALLAKLETLKLHCDAQFDKDWDKFQNSTDERVEDDMKRLIQDNLILEQRECKAQVRSREQKAVQQELERLFGELKDQPLSYKVLMDYKKKYTAKSKRHEQLQLRFNPSQCQNIWATAQVQAPFRSIQRSLQEDEYEESWIKCTKLLHGLMRRRSVQQVVGYGHEIAFKLLLLYHQTWIDFVQELATLCDKTIPHAWDNGRGLIPKKIKKLLVQYYSDDSDACTDTCDQDIVDFLARFASEETARNKEWTKECNASLDAICQLDHVKIQIDELLFGKSLYRDRVHLKPKEYDQMQFVLDRDIEENQQAMDRVKSKVEESETKFNKQMSKAIHIGLSKSDKQSIRRYSQQRDLEAKLHRAKRALRIQQDDEHSQLENYIEQWRSYAQTLAMELLPAYQEKKQQMAYQDQYSGGEHDLGAMLLILGMNTSLLCYDPDQGCFT
ncbi:hypothetical protein DM01DRAFT_1406509 [Hesseltinella vesiculosa]|uniref:Uncharacterized protein n=1 Tax=Hesseltinella vesiculosa TaxID=101127 RepID=A0A1X2GLW3_9FUNG|nr:hypothetical protein DM01DRAFT_1406509 [Hesseltinella vesiculosa]